MTCPPMVAKKFDPTWLEGHQLLYFDLHGRLNNPWWWGDEGHTALTVKEIKAADLSGAVVFAVNCYLADEQSPMMDALLDAGAKLVIGGGGQNWAGAKRVQDAALLGKTFRRLYLRGVPALWSLQLAKTWLRLAALLRRDRNALRDTLAFRAYYRKRSR